MKISDIEVSLVDHMGSDLSVVNAARVSFHKESGWEYPYSEPDEYGDCYCVGQELKKTDTKLIQYLAKHKHTSPFNHAFITCRVKAPIFVARQLVKHKFMPWNEVSRRYVDEEIEHFQLNWRWAADNVKQGSGEEVDEQTQKECDEIFWNVVNVSCDAYEKLLAKGIAAEQARRVTLVDAATEWIWSGTLGAYADMLRLRLDPHTQYESRIVANKIEALIKPLFPVSLAALLEV